MRGPPEFDRLDYPCADMMANVDDLNGFFRSVFEGDLGPRMPASD